MKYLKLFNESKTKAVIKDLESQYLAYLKDVGFVINFYSMERFYKWTNYIGISRNDSGFYWNEVKYDVIAFIEVLMKHYKVTIIKVYTPSDDVHKYVEYSSRSETDNDSISDLINEKVIPDGKLIAIEIMFI